ncbi:MAG TPA: cytochrome c3 family protein [Pseudomonadota bacterium]|nr:cytochrome c3 family protein [Pseudomonadota bacterium]
MRSSRCGECHEKFRIEWSGSSHARANRTPAYRKVIDAASPALRQLCQSCHLPSQAFGQPDEEPNRPSEGVSCDGCHTIKQVQVTAAQATVSFDPSSGSKYGPIVGASGHYFHDMAYSVLHTKSELCASCHHRMEFQLGAEKRAIPVVLSYSDWQKFGKGKQCQDCHMPSRGTEEVARGSKARPNVPSHAFGGALAWGKLIRLELAANAKPGEIAVEIQHNAGHSLPSGYVDRRVLLRVEFFAANGSKLSTEERSYGMVLADAAGQPAPFFQAVRIKEDRRLIPGRVHTESIKLPVAPAQVGVPAPAAVPGAAKVTLSLIAAGTAPELRATYGEPALVVIKTSSYPLPFRIGGSK